MREVLHHPQMFIAFTESLQRVPNSAWVTGGGMAFIAFFAGMAFANGVLKQVINALSIVVSIFVAWTCFRNRTEVFGGAAASMDTDRLMLFCGLAGIITYVLCRLLLRVLTTVGLLGFLANVADTDTKLLPIHFPNPSVGRVASNGDRFRWRYVR